MSHNALKVNDGDSIALSDIVSGTPALNDCITYDGSGYSFGSVAAKDEYAIATLGSTSSAAYTASGTIGEYSSASNRTRFLWNIAKAPGRRTNLFGSGATYDASTFNYTAITVPTDPGWYMLSATLNVRAVSGVVGFRFQLGGPSVFINADTSSFVMSRTIRWVFNSNDMATRKHYIAVITNSASGDNYAANSPSTMTLSYDIVRIG